jgi:hypothetical protein
MNGHLAGIEAYKRQVEFDHRVRGRRTKQEKIGYTFFTGAPDEDAIRKTVAKYDQAGWWYAARKEDEGFLGFGAQTILTFQC